MCKDVAIIANKSGPGFMAAMTSILRWPDRAQARGYITGMRISEDIEETGVFRELKTPLAEKPQTYFGTEASQAVKELMHSKPPKESQLIFEETVKEQSRGWLSRTFSAAELDERYGKGEWRFIPRFILHQKLKDRLIDDAKRGGQNARAIFRETIFTANIDFVGEVLSAFIAELAWSLCGLRTNASTEEVLKALPSWFEPAMGIEDLPDAYRGVPLHPADARMAIVAFWSTEAGGWRFAISRAMLFGLSAAVIHFNRKPTLAVAAVRRFGGVAAAAFFDDIVRLASHSSENSDGSFLETVLNGMGASPSQSKSVPLGQSRVWIGVKTNLGQCTSHGFYEQTPTEGAVQAVVDGCRTAITAKRLDKNDAASLRGKANWSNSHSAGRCGRIGTGVLRRKQQGETPHLSECDTTDLAFLALISSRLPANRVYVAGSRGKPTRVYSDASFEPGDSEPGIGWVIFPPGQRAQGRAAAMPSSIVETLKIRKTQIYAAETYAVLAAVHAHLRELADTDAIFFVDNEAACAALIRGSSKEADVGAIANAVQWLLFSVNCRPWFEWIDSNSNCADGLSRDGLLDAWTQEQGWQLEKGMVPAWNVVTDLKQVALETLGYSGSYG